MDETLEAYTTAPPSAQTQADLFPGEWTSAVPLPDGSTVGGPRADLFADERIDWMLAEVGPLDGMRVLELGPLEGGHTYMLEQSGAADVVAVEAHQRAFLRCLVVKNLLDLRARFELGDFVAYLHEHDDVWDLCVASGVLYHMADPLELLELLGRRARRVFLWTHYYDADVLSERTDVAARFSTGTTERSSRGGYTATLHRYEYGEGAQAPSFCGGSRPHTSWMTRGDILGALEHYGFGKVRFAFDDPQWPHGPAFALVAERG
jgi:SAM-dependent methyltransferase